MCVSSQARGIIICIYSSIVIFLVVWYLLFLRRAGDKDGRAL